MGNYQLRKAAGIYWLIDMEQSGMDYHRPIPMNETGALIWKQACEGKTADAIAKALADCYSIPEEETLVDVQQFFDLLAAKGIRKV